MKYKTEYQEPAVDFGFLAQLGFPVREREGKSTNLLV